MLKLQAKDWVWSLFVVEVIYTYIYIYIYIFEFISKACLL